MNAQAPASADTLDSVIAGDWELLRTSLLHLIMPATVLGYSEWPKGTPNYWALPAMGDAVAFTYRKDWFARPELRAEFKQKHGRDLAPPTWPRRSSAPAPRRPSMTPHSSLASMK